MEKFPVTQPANDNRTPVERSSLDGIKSLEVLISNLDVLCNTYRDLRERMKPFSHIPGTLPHPVNQDGLQALATECHEVEYMIGTALTAIAVLDKDRAVLIMNELRAQGVEWLI